MKQFSWVSICVSRGSFSEQDGRKGVFQHNQNRKESGQKSSRKVEITRDAAVTILTSGCHFNGKLHCRGSTRIGGRIEGEIFSEGLLIIEDEAVILATIRADEAIIQGRVKGRIEARGRVELCPSCHFEGDIMTPSLIIQEGAQFNGRSTMTTSEMGESLHKSGSSSGKLSAVTGDDKKTGPMVAREADVAVVKMTETRT